VYGNAVAGFHALLLEALGATVLPFVREEKAG
jgi:hypothetical protein